MTSKILITACLLGVSVAALSAAAEATCLDTPAATSAADGVSSALQPCDSIRSSNIGIMAGDDDLQLADDWGSRGANDSCNTSTELAKHLNSFMLLTTGVNFNQAQNFNGTSFHASTCKGGDYCILQSESGDPGDWHDHFRHIVLNALPDSSGATFADYDPRSLSVNLLRFTCNLYDTSTPFESLEAGNPTFRAEAILHEAWHAWEDEHGHRWKDTSCGHERCTGDATSPTCQGGECDTWFPHGSVAAGGMNNVMHRPYQVMSEFACDLVNTPQDWVPLIAREIAKQDAAFLGMHNILNGPEPGCNQGVTAGQVDGVCSDSTLQCDQLKSCSGGKICDGETGCCTSPPACTIAGRTTCDGTCACDFGTGCCPAPAPPPP